MRSRKNRVTGEWKVETGSIQISDNNYSITYDISGNTYIAADNFGSATGTASASFVFERDGYCRISINMGGFLNIIEGQWNFTGGIGEKKNKTQIVIHPEKVEDPSGSYTIEGNDNDFTYDVLELRNKKLVLYSADRVNDSNGQFNAFTENWTLVPR